MTYLEAVKKAIQDIPEVLPSPDPFYTDLIRIDVKVIRMERDWYAKGLYSSTNIATSIEYGFSQSEYTFIGNLDS